MGPRLWRCLFPTTASGCGGSVSRPILNQPGHFSPHHHISLNLYQIPTISVFKLGMQWSTICLKQIRLPTQEELHCIFVHLKYVMSGRSWPWNKSKRIQIQDFIINSKCGNLSSCWYPVCLLWWPGLRRVLSRGTGFLQFKLMSKWGGLPAKWLKPPSNCSLPKGTLFLSPIRWWEAFSRYCNSWLAIITLNLWFFFDLLLSPKQSYTRDTTQAWVCNFLCLVFLLLPGFNIEGPDFAWETQQL